MTRIVIADDHPFMRSGLEAVLRASGFEICGSAADGDSAIALVGATDPDVIVLDVQMPGRDGISVLKALRTAGCKRPIILLTAYLDDARLVSAVHAGASAIVFKQGAEQHLIETIGQVLRGECGIDPDLLARARELEDSGLAVDRFESLAPRERQIVEAVGRGLRNREIGAELGIAEGSVKVYLNRIFDKLGVENRTELAVRVHERSRGS